MRICLNYLQFGVSNCGLEEEMDGFGTTATDYDADFVAWLESQISLMRERRFEQLDVDNLLEELEGTVRREHRELRHRLEVLMVHLLKWQFQSHRQSRSWQSTLSAQRTDIEELLNDSPSLKRRVGEYAIGRYPSAVRKAAEQTRLPFAVFPASCPYTVDQLLDFDFLP
jgi:hypothetical protein